MLLTLAPSVFSYGQVVPRRLKIPAIATPHRYPAGADRGPGQSNRNAASAAGNVHSNLTIEGVSLDAPDTRPSGSADTTRPKMHADEIDIGPELVHRLVASQFPHWEDLSLTEIPSAGTVNAIYRLGPDMLVRLPRSPTYATDVESDLQVLLPLAGRRLPLEIPVILAMGRPVDDYPFVWGVYRWIEGHPWSATPPEDLYGAADDLAGFVRALQSFDPSGARPGYRGSPLAPMGAMVRDMINGAADLISVEMALRAWEESLAAPAWSRAPVWFHGDLLPTNLVVAHGRLQGVIDFGCCGTGDPAIEYSTAWTLFPAEVRQHYRAAVHVDDATWLRARGWALVRGVAGYGYYRETNPEFAHLSWLTLQEVLADAAHDL